MRIVRSLTLALLVGMGTALAFPCSEIPTTEAAYVAKVKTAAPEEIVAKATIVMMQDGKERSLQTAPMATPARSIQVERRSVRMRMALHG